MHEDSTGSPPDSELENTPVRPRPTRGENALGAFLLLVTFSGILIAPLSLASAIEDREASGYELALGFVCASIASACALVWVVRLVNAGVTGLPFVEATATIRSVVAAWVLFSAPTLLMGVGALTGLLDIWGPDRTVVFESINRIFSLVGAIALIGLFGSGYTEFRKGMAGAVIPRERREKIWDPKRARHRSA